MIAYKAFSPGFICRGYQFKLGEKNVTDAANCKKNGFHCAEDPLDCLSYYPDIRKSVYCLVEIGGDMHEDGTDSKISCTELTIRKELSLKTYFFHILVYMAKNKNESMNYRIQKECATASGGYAIVCGLHPIAKGKVGDILAFAQKNGFGDIDMIAVLEIDGEALKPDTYYNILGKEEALENGPNQTV